MSEFGEQIAKAYAVEGAALEFGRGIINGAIDREAVVQVPLSMMTRHGLITGATGTGKTSTLRILTEQLSAAGVPVLAADMKGDVSGIAKPGETGSHAEKRAQEFGVPFVPQGFPVEYLSLGGIGPGVPVRTTVSDFGPLLLAKVLDASEVQEQSLQLLFRYADDRALPLVDLTDLRALLQYLTTDDAKAELQNLGAVSAQTVGALLRKLVALEDGGGSEYFGEPQLEVAELMRTASDGRGVVSCLELPAVQDKPKLWSTALMGLVAELFETLPEVGDLPKPKLVVFVDEAHLLFTDASKAFRESVTQTVRLIRSKGVGIFFVTQAAKDVDEDVLAQLGNRVQHAMRAFTPNDAKALKATVSTFPKSEVYDLEELLPQLGIGEAVVTILDQRGIPTPVVHTRIKPPQSLMGQAPDLLTAAQASPLFAKYGTRVDLQSARELLAARLEAAAPPPVQAKAPLTVPDAPEPRPRERARSRKEEGGGIGDFFGSRQGKALEREVVRGIFGLLKKRL